MAFVIDPFRRTLVGWQVSTAKDTAFVESCLKMALWCRDQIGYAVERGMIHLADAGSQRTSTTTLNDTGSSIGVPAPSI